MHVEALQQHFADSASVERGKGVRFVGTISEVVQESVCFDTCWGVIWYFAGLGVGYGGD